jgi:hypothetical protein
VGFRWALFGRLWLPQESSHIIRLCSAPGLQQPRPSPPTQPTVTAHLQPPQSPPLSVQNPPNPPN